MEAEPPAGPPSREIHLEGKALAFAAAVLLLMLGAAFWLGRAYERAVAPAAGAVGAGPVANLSREIEGSPDDLTFFDTLSGAGKAAEPEREARRPKTEPQPAPAASPSAGPFVVQVFAGRDRRAAEELVSALRGRGYPVRLEGEREGSGALFRVRVGGYASRAEAQAAAERLAREGHAGAWVTRRD